MPSVFRPGDLEKISKKIIMEKVPKRLFVRNGVLVNHEPISFGQRTHTWEYVNIQGQAIVGVFGGTIDVSGTDIFIDERTAKLRPIKQGWQVHTDDLDSAKFAQRDLRPAKITAAAQLVLDAIDRVGFVGHTPAQIYGIANQPNANVLAIPADGTGGTTEFENKNYLQIVRDLESIVYNVPSQVDGTYMTPRVLLGTRSYLAGVREKGGNNDESALTVFRKNARQYYPDVEIINCPYLDTAGPGGTSVAVCYNPDSEYLSYLKTPGVRRSKVFEDHRGFFGTMDCVVGGIALIQPIAFTTAFGV